MIPVNEAQDKRFRLIDALHAGIRRRDHKWPGNAWIYGNPSRFWHWVRDSPGASV